MTQSQLIQKMVDRVIAIAENDNPTLSAGYLSPASAETRLPLLLPMPGIPDYTKSSQGSFNLSMTFNLFLYIKKYGSGYDIVNQVDVNSWVDQLANTFLARETLPLNDNGLSYVRSSVFTIVSNLSDPVSYPPKGGQDKYWGFQSRLVIEANNFTVQQG